MNHNSVFNYFFMTILCSFLFVGCKENKNQQKEDAQDKQAQQNQVNKRTSKEQRYAAHISEIHKAKNYQEEAFVGFELDIQFADFKDEVKIVKATNFSQIQFSSKKHGDFYWIGEDLLSPETSTLTGDLAKNYLDLAFIFGAFSQIYNEDARFGEIDEKEAFEAKFKEFEIDELNTDFRWAPKHVVSWTDSRTDMLKALVMNFNLTEQETLFYFDRYITVNRIPVSLTWKVFEPNKTNNLEESFGEVKVSRIKYYSAGEYEIQLPEELKEVQLFDLAQ